MENFLRAHERPPGRIILDLDASDDPVHGEQEGRFFHGYYGHYCYLPLYIFCGNFLLCARLRPSNIDASAGAVGELERDLFQLEDSAAVFAANQEVRGADGVAVSEGCVYGGFFGGPGSAVRAGGRWGCRPRHLVG